MLEPLLSAALKLDENDRIEIARQLLESVDSPNPHQEFSEQEFVQMLEQRANELANGEIEGIPWHVVEKQLRQKLEL